MGSSVAADLAESHGRETIGALQGADYAGSGLGKPWGCRAMSQLRLLADEPSKPWPEEIVDSLNGHMTVIVNGIVRLYCVRDWVYVMSGSTSRNLNNPLHDLKRALSRQGEWQRIYESFIEAPNPCMVK